MRSGRGLLGLAAGICVLSAGCAPSWNTEIAADPGGAFRAVWGAAWDDVWVVGGLPDDAYALWGSAGTWGEVALPDGAEQLTAVHGAGGSEVWLVGTGGVRLRWDGLDLQDHSGGDDDLLAVASFDADEAYAAGSRGDAPLLSRWDGEAWGDVDLPGSLPVGTALTAAGWIEGALWLVGDTGAAMLGRGSSFAVVPVDGPWTLSAVDGDADGVLAVATTGELLRGDADGLEVVLSVPVSLRAIRRLGAFALVAGDGGYLSIWDLADDTIEVVDPGTGADLRGLFGFDRGAAYAVGGATADGAWQGALSVGQSPR